MHNTILNDISWSQLECIIIGPDSAGISRWHFAASGKFCTSTVGPKRFVLTRFLLITTLEIADADKIWTAYAIHKAWLLQKIWAKKTKQAVRYSSMKASRKPQKMEILGFSGRGFQLSHSGRHRAEAYVCWQAQVASQTTLQGLECGCLKSGWAAIGNPGDWCKVPLPCRFSASEEDPRRFLKHSDQ